MPGASAAARQQRAATTLILPGCVVPRPGAHVYWYAQGRRREGVLIGHDKDGCPVVRTAQGITKTLQMTLDQLTRIDGDAEEPRAWDWLPPGAIVEPLENEADAFKAAMEHMTPPGIRYCEMARAVCARGFELLVVGGAVRDILARTVPHDLDVVTSMPLVRAQPLFEQMYELEITPYLINGFVRIGKPYAFRGRFIDVRAIIEAEDGDEGVIFGSNLLNDYRQRDFACNAVYYDPHNQVLLDPSLRGIEDSLERRLTLIYDAPEPRPQNLAEIGLRFVKFLMRGFRADTALVDTIRTRFLPKLHSMTPPEIREFVRRQFLSKVTNQEREGVLLELERRMRDIGFATFWDELIAPAMARAKP